MSAALQSLARVPASAPIEEMLRHIEADGGVIVEGMFPEAVVSQMHEAAIERAEAIVPGSATQGMGEAGAAFVGANTIRFSSLGRLSPAYFDMLDNEVFAALADAVLLPTCGSYWVNTGQVMFIGPGEEAQVLHRDADNWWELVHRTWPDSPEITLSSMIGLGDVTEALGATRVVPGSHRRTELEHYTSEETVPAELGPGDAFIYLGSVLHGGGANVTDEWRHAMHLSFVAGWLTPEEACPLDYDLGELADRSERVQMLLGHQSYTPGGRRGGGLWLKDVKAMQEAD